MIQSLVLRRRKNRRYTNVVVIVEAEPSANIESASAGLGIAAAWSFSSEIRAYSCSFGEVLELPHGSSGIEYYAISTVAAEQAAAYYYIMIPSLDHDDNTNEQSFEGRDLLILYATETGTAQDAADHIARECRRIHFNCRVSSMHAYPLVSLAVLSSN